MIERFLPILPVDVDKLDFSSMSEEHNVRDWIKRKTVDTFKLICKYNAVASVHSSSDHCLLDSNIGPEEKTSNRMNCDASWLL